MSDSTIEVEGVFLHETDKAVLLDVDGEDVWLPFSEIEELDTTTLDGAEFRTYLVPEWLAIKKGIA